MRFLKFLIVFLFSIHNYYGQKTFLNWEGYTVVDYGGYQHQLPFFKNDRYTVINGIPHYVTTLRQQESNAYEIKNLVWEKISPKDLYGLKIDHIPNEEIAEAVNQKINSETVTNLLVAAFKKEGQLIYRLESFELVKKNLTSRASKTFKNFGTTENPLKTGVFYKIKVSKSGIFKITSKFLRDNGINPSGINPKNFRIYGNGGLMLPEFNGDFRYKSLQEDAIQVFGEEDGKWDEGDYALF